MKQAHRPSHRPHSRFGSVLLALALLVLLLPGWAAAQARASEDRAALQQRYERLRPQMEKSAFGRPLLLESTQSESQVQGDVYARLDQPFDTLREALAKPESWCAIFILHLNNKYCGVAQDGGRPQLVVKVGKKEFQELSSTFTMKMGFIPVASERDYLEVRMDAPHGPLGTENYRMMLAAIPVGPNQSFMHMRYSHSFGRLGKMAMDAYLSTAGRNKIGFTRTGVDGEGKPEYVQGFRGAVERNAMRYYLAADAFLMALSQPPDKRTEYALKRWFDSTEQFAPQLHEISRADYLDMKRREITRARETPAETVE